MKLSQLEVFEVYAHVFRQMTGMMAPGKDVAAMANDTQTHESRSAAYDEWWKNNGRACVAMVRGVEEILQGDDDIEDLKRDAWRRQEEATTQQRVAIRMQEERDAAVSLLRRVMAMTVKNSERIADDIYSFLQPNSTVERP